MKKAGLEGVVESVTTINHRFQPVEYLCQGVTNNVSKTSLLDYC